MSNGFSVDVTIANPRLTKEAFLAAIAKSEGEPLSDELIEKIRAEVAALVTPIITVVVIPRDPQ